MGQKTGDNKYVSVAKPLVGDCTSFPRNVPKYNFFLTAVLAERASARSLKISFKTQTTLYLFDDVYHNISS